MKHKLELILRVMLGNSGFQQTIISDPEIYPLLEKKIMEFLTQAVQESQVTTAGTNVKQT